MIKSDLQFLVLLLLTPFIAISQEEHEFDLSCQIDRVFAPLSISHETFKTAKHIEDLNRTYKNSWIREFLSVEITAEKNGKQVTAKSKDDVLTQEQIELMKMADAGSGISVHIKYIPENTLKQNDPKEINFTFTVDPENPATYPGGKKALRQYLDDQVVGHISPDQFNRNHLTAVKFTVDEEGHIVDSKVFESSGDEKLDALLLNAIKNMPNWTPAEFNDGTKVKQEYALSVGDRESCIVNLLNIRRLPRVE